jgi:ornithine carbamoyltransferase
MLCIGGCTEDRPLMQIKDGRSAFGTVRSVIQARHVLDHRRLWSIDGLSGADLLAVLEVAQRLKRARREGRTDAPLRGRNLAMLSDAEPTSGAGSLRRAASELGAQVAHLRPSEARLAPGGDTEATARLLGRLYDAIDCTDMAPSLVEDVARGVDVPVYNGLAKPAHPTRVLAELLALQESCGKPLDRIGVCFVGDARSPCGDALLQTAAVTGLNLCICTQGGSWPDPDRLGLASQRAGRRGAWLRAVESVADAGSGIDAVIDGPGDPPWALRAGAPVDRRDDQHFALQALLVATIG